jgi:hypothetical protein
LHLFEEMPQVSLRRNVVSYNASISALETQRPGIETKGPPNDS